MNTTKVRTQQPVAHSARTSVAQRAAQISNILPLVLLIRPTFGSEQEETCPNLYQTLERQRQQSPALSSDM